MCTAGPQPGTFPAQCAPLDLNLGLSQLSVHRWTSTWDLPSSIYTAGPQRPDKMTKDMPDRMSDRILKDIPKNIPDRMLEGMPNKMPVGMPDKVPEYLLDKIPEDLLDKISDRITGDMLENMPNKVPEDMPEQIAKDIPTRMPENISDRMPDKMPEGMPDRMLENLSIKYINIMVGITRNNVFFFFHLWYSSEYFLLEPVVTEKRTKKLMVRQLRGQQQWSVRHGLKLHSLSKSFLLASLLQGDFRVMELGAFERQLSPTVLLPSRSAAQRVWPKLQKR